MTKRKGKTMRAADMATMRGWRGLKAARDRRELRRARESIDRGQKELSAARNERDRALRSPMLALKRDAMQFLAARTAEALSRASDEFIANALREIERTGLSQAEVSASVNDWDMLTVFRVEIPRATYHFTADVGRLKDLR